MKKPTMAIPGVAIRMDADTVPVTVTVTACATLNAEVLRLREVANRNGLVRVASTLPGIQWRTPARRVVPGSSSTTELVVDALFGYWFEGVAFGKDGETYRLETDAQPFPDAIV